MSEKENPGVPFVSDDDEEQKLWNELERVSQAEPPPRLRAKFYGELDRIGRSTPMDRWRAWLGFSGNRGLVTALGCAMVGVFMGILLATTDSTTDSVDRSELSALQQQVAQLNRNLILDRLENESASKRLRGVIDAAGVAEHDSEIARALLTTAVDDRVYSVRAAAIDAIGPQLNTPAVGDELMGLLEKSESPLVQLALVDLVLRHGNAQQLEELVELSKRGALHPELAQYVQSAIQRSQV
jgi:HEAT repeat protein